MNTWTMVFCRQGSTDLFSFVPQLTAGPRREPLKLFIFWKLARPIFKPLIPIVKKYLSTNCFLISQIPAI